MKRIALLIDSMNGGGAQRVVSHLSTILKEDYDARVVLFDDSYSEFQCDGKLHTLNVPAESGNVFVKLKLLRKRIKNLKNYIRNEKIDCVISFLDSPNFVNLLTKAKGCRKIISIRNYSRLDNARSAMGKLKDIVMQRLYRKANCVATVTKVIEKDFCTYYRVPREKLVTIYNPYNFSQICEKGNASLQESEKRFFENGFVFINVGRVMYQKGHWHLVKAFSMVYEKHPEAKLVIVGEDFSDGKLTGLISSLGLTHSVLLTGKTRNPYQYMKNAHCYVMPSLFEGFPNALVEAMASECAVVCADCKSGPREILYETPDLDAVANTVTLADYGILVPPMETEENWDQFTITEGQKMLAQAMERLLVDSALYKKYALLACKRSHTFDFSAARQKFCKIIEGE